MNKYEKLRHNLLRFLSENFEQHLMMPTSLYFSEIFFFDDISVQNHIIGAHRAAIHTALNDPYCYLQVIYLYFASKRYFTQVLIVVFLL